MSNIRLMVDILDRFVVLSVLSDPEVTARCLASALFILLGISAKNKKQECTWTYFAYAVSIQCKLMSRKWTWTWEFFLLHCSGVNAVGELLGWGEVACDHMGELKLKWFGNQFPRISPRDSRTHRVKVSEALNPVFKSDFGLDPQKTLKCLNLVLQHLICERIAL